ncbi:MAG: CoA transferase [Clostridia bacterium]|nr:CoA transferase [Clostridia bacterium]
MKALEGVKVVEMATFVAVPSCGLFLANQGAEVIKVEPKSGDLLRWTGASEWRSASPYENTTYDYLNANKQSIVLNLKDPKGKEALFKLLEDCDIFLTNWRTQALAKQGLTYEELHKKFPKMVFASLTGYGEKGPDKDLPGYDFTAFWGRGGALGSLKDREQRPFILAPGFGDTVAGMALGEAVLAAYIKALKTGNGEKVSTNLVHSSVFCQATMLQSEQFEGIGKSYPLTYKEINNPFNGAYKSKDGKYIQACVPPFNMLFGKYMTALGRPDLVDNKKYNTMESIAENDLYAEFIEIMEDAYSKKTAEEWKQILTEADIPFAICQTWKDILVDPQIAANDVFYDMEYPTGLKVKLVRHPAQVGEELPDFKIASYLGADTESTLKKLGYTDAELEEMHAAGIYNTWDDLKAAHNG